MCFVVQLRLAGALTVAITVYDVSGQDYYACPPTISRIVTAESNSAPQPPLPPPLETLSIADALSVVSYDSNAKERMYDTAVRVLRITGGIRIRFFMPLCFFVLRFVFFP